jgi:hypothetical protein
MSKSRYGATRQLLGYSVWLHVGYVGAVAVAAGLLQLIDGNATTLSALGLACSGGVLAAASWRRAFNALERAELPSFTADSPTAGPESPWSPALSND